jgi:RHS repeat-associated protein
MSRSINSINQALCGFVLLSVFLLGRSVQAQQSTMDSVLGIMPNSTHGAGGLDLATSNVYVSLPVRTKGGMSFSLIGNFQAYFYNANPNSNPLWGPAFEVTGVSWQIPSESTPPQPLNFTASGLSGGLLGSSVNGNTYLSFRDACGQNEDLFTSFYGVIDRTGAYHPLTSVFTIDNWGCGGTSGSSMTTDSEYTVAGSSNPTTGIVTTTLYDNAGNSSVVTGTNYCCYSGAVTSSSDPNANTMSGSASTSTWVDPVGGSENPFLTLPNSQTYSWTDAAGTPRSVVVTISPVTAQTAFGCSGALDLGPVADDLPTSISLPTGGTYRISYEQTPGSSSNITGRIAKIVYPSGGSVSYSYSDSSGHHGINCASFVVPTVKVTINDNNGNANTWTYVNSNTSTPTNWGVTAAVMGPPLGNFTVTETDPAGNQTIHSFAGEYQTQTMTYEGGCPTGTTGCSGGGTLLRTITTCYNTNFTNCATPSSIPTLPILQTDIYTSFNGSSSNLVETRFDIYGNTIEVKRYGFGAAIPPTGNPLSDTLTFYGQSWNGTSCTAYPSGIYIRNTPCYTYVRNSASQTVAQTQITYSNTGHPTSTVTLTSGSSSLTRTATFNTNGKVNTATDVNEALSRYTYNGTGDCNLLLPTSVAVTGSGLPSSGLTSSTQWDCNGEVITSTTDADGQPTDTNYEQNGVGDPLYRPLSVVDALRYATDLSYSATTFESALNFNGTTSTSDTLTTTDGVGRQIFSQTRQGQGPSITTFDTTQTTYGWTTTTSTVPGGPFTKQTVPYSGSAGQSAPAGTPVNTTQDDALGRPLAITDGGGGTVSYQYIKNDVLQTIGPAPSGENTKRRQLEYDGLGRLTSVCEITSASGSGAGACSQSNPETGLLTEYTYDALGNLLTVTQNAQPGAIGGTQTRTYAYDGLSRLTSETNPESGTTLYFYDTAPTTPGAACPSPYNGDLVKRYDASGNTTCYAYDALHRVTSTTYGGPNATTNKYFVYDVATVNGEAMANALGRPAEAYTATCSTCSKLTDEAFSYTARGELANFYESTPNSAGYYSVPITYWANGLVETFGPFLTYRSLGYNPDGEGRPYSFQFVDLLASTSYIQNGQPTGNRPTQLMTPCANGTCYPISYQYDPNTLRMTQYSYALADGTVSGSLTWNPNGSLQKLVIADPFNSADAQTCEYSADDLSRIAGVSCGSTWAQTFTYDAFGNLTKNGSISWIPGYNTSTNQYSLAGTSYDADGNLLKDTFNYYTWDAEGKNLSTAYDNGSGETWTFTYDAFGHKVEASANGSYQGSYVTLGNYKLSALGQTANYSLYPLPGGSFISEGGGWTGVQMADWLGTIRAVASDSADVIQTGAHAPFGEEYSFTSGYPKPSIFTGQLDDGNDNPTMYYFQERQYPSSQGRWLSPDPVGLAAVDRRNPQSWNRYAYVLNSPLSNTDPLGLWCYYGTTDDNGFPDLSSPDAADNGNWDMNSTQPECEGPNGTNGGRWYPDPIFMSNVFASPTLVDTVLSSLPLSLNSFSNCTAPNFVQKGMIKALKGIANAAGKTVGFGAGGSYGAGIAFPWKNFKGPVGVYGTVSAQLMVSPDGSAYLSYSWAGTGLSSSNGRTQWLFPVVGVGGVGGIQGSVANGPPGNGSSFDFNGGGADPWGGSLDLNVGVNPNGSVNWQATGTAGAGGGGFGGGGAVVDTTVVPLCHD